MSIRQAPATTFPVVYKERQWIPWWWIVVALAVAVLLSAQLHLGRPQIWAILPYLVTIPVALGALWQLSRHQIVVTADGQGSGFLQIDGAKLPFDAMGRIVAVPATAKQAAMGRQLDPAAFVSHRPWIKEMVYIAVDDADDPTPYWLISSREVGALLDALPTSALGESLDVESGRAGADDSDDTDED